MRSPRSSSTTIRFAAFTTALVGLIVGASGCAEQLGLPTSASEQGDTVGRVFNTYLIAAYIVGGIVVGLIFFVIIRDRASRRSGPASQRSHNTPLEIIYTAIPLMIIIALSVVTLLTIYKVGGDDPNPDLEVEVEGFQWGWRFVYPDEGVVVEGNSDDQPELVLPSPARVRFTMHADDVIHSFWIPGFRFKRDMIPGRDTSFTVDLNELATYDGKCAEYCGLLHAEMRFSARTVSPEDFDKWVEEQKRDQK